MRRSVTQTNVTSQCVIHSNNRHRHQSLKMMGLSYPDSDFKIILVELSNTDKSLRSFPQSVIQFHLFFIFDFNISPFIQFFTISEVLVCIV